MEASAEDLLGGEVLQEEGFFLAVAGFEAELPFESSAPQIDFVLARDCCRVVAPSRNVLNLLQVQEVLIAASLPELVRAECVHLALLR